MKIRSYCLLLGLLGCRKQALEPALDPTAALPPATQSGQRTFGCLVNGEPWTPAGNPFGGPLFSAGYTNQNLYLTANRAVITPGGNLTQRIQMEVDSIVGPGVYVLRNATSRSAELSDRERNCLFRTDASHPATVDITRLDPVARIVSGRFSFTLETPNCGRVTVTDGRFDSRF